MSKKKLILFYTLCLLLLAITCRLPWAYYSDIQQTFTGFYSYQNYYGKPAYLLLTLGSLNGLSLFLSYLWARFFSLTIMSILMAYAIRSFYLFSACHFGSCPQIKIGLWIMLPIVLAMFSLSLMGKIKVKK